MSLMGPTVFLHCPFRLYASIGTIVGSCRGSKHWPITSWCRHQFVLTAKAWSAQTLAHSTQFGCLRSCAARLFSESWIRFGECACVRSYTLPRQSKHLFCRKWPSLPPVARRNTWTSFGKGASLDSAHGGTETYRLKFWRRLRHGTHCLLFQLLLRSCIFSSHMFCQQCPTVRFAPLRRARANAGRKSARDQSH